MGRYKESRIEKYIANWDKITEILSEMPSSDEIKDMLALVGLDVNELVETYGEKKIEEAVLYAKDLKDRYTILWMYYDINGDKNEPCKS